LRMDPLPSGIDYGSYTSDRCHLKKEQTGLIHFGPALRGGVDFWGALSAGFVRRGGLHPELLSCSPYGRLASESAVVRSGPPSIFGDGYNLRFSAAAEKTLGCPAHRVSFESDCFHLPWVGYLVSKG